MKRLLAGLAIAGLLLRAFLTGPPSRSNGSFLWGAADLFSVAPAWSDPAPTATDIMEKALGKIRTYSRFYTDGTFSARIDVTRADPDFLASYLPPFRDSSGLSHTLMHGTVSIDKGTEWRIELRDLTESEGHVFRSSDGFNLDGVPYQAPAAPPSVIPTESPASPTPGATPEASALPSPTPSPSASAQHAADAELYRFHPLTLLWPLILKNPNFNFTLAGEDFAGSDKCWLIDAAGTDVKMRIWVTEKSYAVRRVQYPDPKDDQWVVANYSSFYSLPDPNASPSPGVAPSDDGLMTYRHCDLVKGSRALLQVTVAEMPTLTVPKTTAPPIPIIDPRQHFDVPPILGWGLTIIVVGLLIALAWYGGRYVIFLVSRLEFSREVILVEAEGGPMGKALTELGFTVLPCTMEVLTEERKHLGKKPGVVQPRAVVVAPNAFSLIKGYLFLLRAYVEEGGRVLVLNHSPSAVPSMPFEPYFVPNMGEGKNVVLSRPNFWRRLRVEDVETKTGHLLPREFYVEVNHKKVDVDLVQVFNQATGVRATAIGVVRDGKGEFMLCQLNLADDLSKNSKAFSPVARLLFLDLMDYLQARPPEKKPTAKRSA